MNGRNWPAVEKAWTRDAGAWRVEVCPSTPARQDLFLHVLETDGNEIAASDAVALIRKPGQIGIRIRAQGRDYVVMFSATTTHLRIGDHGRGILDTDVNSLPVMLPR